MIKIIEKAFSRDHKRYLGILNTYYPAHDDIGFTERNLSHNFIIALEKELGDRCISWLEAPIDITNKRHIDGVVFDINRKSIFLIESKRFTSKSKIRSAKKDFERMRSEEHIKLLENGLYDTNIEKRYAILLADVWTENKTKQEILASWPNCVVEENVFFSMHKGFKSLKTKEQWKYDYNIMIAVQEIKI